MTLLWVRPSLKVNLIMQIFCSSSFALYFTCKVLTFDLGLTEETTVTIKYHTLHRVATMAAMTSGGHSNVISFRCRSAGKKKKKK